MFRPLVGSEFFNIHSPITNAKFALSRRQTTPPSSFQNHVDARAAFELFLRHLSPHRDYLVTAGLEQALNFLENVRFPGDEVSYIRALPIFSHVRSDFFDYLSQFHFVGDVWALPEGTISPHGRACPVQSRPLARQTRRSLSPIATVSRNCANIYGNLSSRRRAPKLVGVVLITPKTVFWEVDAQADFMLAGGKLYVPGAEQITPSLNRLVETVRQGRVFLISSADAHNPDDPELRDWPPHCLRGTPGADLLPEACASSRLIIPNEKGFVLPGNVTAYQQVTLQKNTLDVFDNPNTDALLARLNPAGSPGFDLNPEFVVFGVATEYCVRLAVDGVLRRGRRVSIVTDAVRSLNHRKGQDILESLESCGARPITSEEALKLVGV